MTTNDKLLIFHRLTPALRGRARQYANGCPHRAGDILAAAADLFVVRLREIGGEGQMVALGKLCLAEAARAERKAIGGHRRVEANWDAWTEGGDDGDSGEDEGVGLRRWQQSPLADRRMLDDLDAVARRESVDQLFARLADAQEQAFWHGVNCGYGRPEAAKQAGLTQVQVTRMIQRLRTACRAEDATGRG